MDDPTTSAEQPHVHDPFRGHLDFLARVDARRAVTLADRLTLEPLDPIGVDVDAAVDMDVLEAIADWQGLLQMPRDKRPDELDPEVDAHMKHCMPQFHLRNIGRAQRNVEPDGDLELSHDEILHGLHAPGVKRPPLGPYVPIPLLEETNLDAVNDHRRRMRWLIHETQWNRHVSQELKSTIAGPLWRYHADEEADE